MKKGLFITLMVIATLLTKGLALLIYGVYRLIKYKREKMVGSIIAVVAGVALLAMPVSGGSSDTKSSAAPAAQPEKAPQKQETPAPAEDPADKPQTVEQKIRGNVNTLVANSIMELKVKDLQINDYLGDGAKSGDKIVIVRFHVGNINSSGVETREQLLRDVVPFFHRIFKIPQVAEVDVHFDVPGMDSYGKDIGDIESAMKIGLTRTTAQKMNFDYMEAYYDQFAQKADMYEVLPALNSNQ